MNMDWLDTRKKVTLFLIMVQGIMIAFAVNYIVLQDFSSRPNLAQSVLNPNAKNETEVISQVKGATSELAQPLTLVEMTTGIYRLETTIPDSQSQIYGFDFDILLKEGLRVKEFRCNSNFNCLVNEVGENKVRISALVKPDLTAESVRKVTLGQFIIAGGSKGIMLFNAESARTSEISNQYGINLFTVENYAIRVGK